jgi:hypothetical protein
LAVKGNVRSSIGIPAIPARLGVVGVVAVAVADVPPGR